MVYSGFSVAGSRSMPHRVSPPRQTGVPIRSTLGGHVNASQMRIVAVVLCALCALSGCSSTPQGNHAEGPGAREPDSAAMQTWSLTYAEVFLLMPYIDGIAMQDDQPSWLSVKGRRRPVYEGERIPNTNVIFVHALNGRRASARLVHFRRAATSGK